MSPWMCVAYTGYEHWKVAILYTELLDFIVEESLDSLPDPIGPGADDIAATDVVVLYQLPANDHLETQTIRDRQRDSRLEEPQRKQYNRWSEET